MTKQRGTLLEVTIEKLVFGGDGLARHEGKVVFVPQTIPGEICKVEVIKEKKDCAWARIVEIIEESPHRVIPKCKYYQKCGGCHYQHINDEKETDFKIEILKDTLKRIGHIAYDEDIFVLKGKSWGYRNRARLHASSRGRLGFKGAKSNKILEVSSCPILDQELGQLALKKTYARNKEHKFFSWNKSSYYGVDDFAIQLMGKKIHLSNNVFFQSNIEVLERVIEKVQNFKGEVAMDLFSGIGLFSLYLADHFEKIYSVEIDKKCVSYARKHLPDNVEHFAEPVENWVSRYEDVDVDLLIVDPPRQGLEKTAIESIGKIKPKKLIYISCHPVTMARDLKLICDAGFKINTVNLLDFFPQTFHIESYVELSY